MKKQLLQKVDVLKGTLKNSFTVSIKTTDLEVNALLMFVRLLLC